MDGQEHPIARSLMIYLGNVEDTMVDVIMPMENNRWRFGFSVQMDGSGERAWGISRRELLRW